MRSQTGLYPLTGVTGTPFKGCKRPMAELGRFRIRADPLCSNPSDDSAAVEELLKQPNGVFDFLEGDDLLGVLRDVGPPHIRLVRLGPLRWMTTLENTTMDPAGAVIGMPGSDPK